MKKREFIKQMPAGVNMQRLGATSYIDRDGRYRYVLPDGREVSRQRLHQLAKEKGA